MRKQFFSKVLTLAISVLFVLTLQAQQFHFTDLATQTNSSPYNYQFDMHSMYAEYNGYLYFSADDGVHGRELYRSNGTTAGTELVTELVAGTGFSNVTDIRVAGGLLYFTVQDGSYRSKLWVTDGTAAGTSQVIIDNAMINIQEAIFLTNVNGKLFFFYSYYDNYGGHSLLASTDATGRAAVSISSINGFPQELVSLNGKLYFTYFDYNSGGQSELFVSDGTAAGTYIVADVNNDPNVSSMPYHLTAVGGQLYFAANDGSGSKLWVTDGTWYNTHPVKNDNNIVLGQDQGFGVNPFCVSNGVLYFQGASSGSGMPGNTGVELCKFNSNDATAGVELVKDIIPGTTGSLPRNFTDVNGTLYFTVRPTTTSEQLWKSNGMSAGTVLVKDINPGEPNYFFNLTNLGGQLLFSYSNDALGAELWRSNGTAAGTVLVRDFLPGKGSGFPSYTTVFQNKAFFSASDSRGNELWQSDGTAAGTTQVKDINTSATADSYPIGFTGLGRKTIFASYNAVSNGNNVFAIDDAGKAPVLLDSNASVRSLFGSSPEIKAFSIYKRHAYFADFNNKLWQTTGTAKGTSLLPIKAFVGVDSGFITNVVASGKYLFVFALNYTSNIVALWSTDGTQAGTRLLKSDFTGFFNQYPTIMGNTLYFTNVDNAHGSELWKSDGTPSGTVLVRTVGSFNYNPLANLCVFNNKLYFSGYTSEGLGPVLWQSDGTPTGTKVLCKATVYSQAFGQANGKLFFYGYDNAETGYELFASDGTATGTGLVKDVNPEPYSSSLGYSYPSSLISGDNILFFAADDGIHGPEIWKSDGTTAGTMLIKDVIPGFNFFKGAANVAGHLYYVTYDDVLYQTDGTAANTHVVTDPVVQGVSNIINLTAVGNELYFSGYKYGTGQELYSATVLAKGNKTANSLSNPDNSFVETSTGVQLKLSPDPAKDLLQVQLNTKDYNGKSQLTILSMAGVVMKTQLLKPGARTLSINISAYKPGMYFVKIDGNGKTLFSRFIKL